MSAAAAAATPASAARSESALATIQHLLVTTPLVRSVSLEAAAAATAGDDAATHVLLKLESEQVTGSFKARGAAHKMHLCKQAGVKRVVTASTGNHALASIHALQKLGLQGSVYIPVTAAAGKVRRVEQQLQAGGGAAAGVSVVREGTDCEVSEVCARRAAEAEAKTGASVVYASPYNDADVITGQSTCAVEIVRQLDGVCPDNVFVSVGGGGLISGVAGYLKAKAAEQGREVTVIGCQPEKDACMLRCVEAGKIVKVDGGETFSDGTAGNVDEGSITLPHCINLVDRWVTVTEGEIASAVKATLDNDAKLIEGAAGVAVAAFLKSPAAVTKGKTSVIIICGGNVSSEKLLHMLGAA